MQFRAVVCACVVMSGCLHRGADAISTAVGVLAASAAHDAVKTPTPTEDAPATQGTEPAPEVAPAPPVHVDPPKAPEQTKSDAQALDEELGKLVAEHPNLGPVLQQYVWCNPDDAAQIRQELRYALSACRDGWNTHEAGDGFGPEESMELLRVKGGFESLITDCGGSPDERAMAQDFYAHVWKPGDPGDGSAPYPWPSEWDGCFGTPPPRVAQGTLLDHN